MVKNFAEEMIGRSVGMNWVSDFCRRHQSELKSLYLRNIEHLRVKGEYGPTYKLFYDLVKCFFALLSCTTCKTLANACFTLVTPSRRRQSNYYRQYLQLGREGLLNRDNAEYKEDNIPRSVEVGKSTTSRTRRKQRVYYS